MTGHTSANALAHADRHSDAPSLLACAVALLAIRVALKALGLGSTMSAARALAARSGAQPPSGTVLIDATVRRVATAAALFPGRALCLEQSLALYYHLRRRGIPAELRLGVRHTPFAAHAWVEWNGEPLHEQRDFINQFTPLPRVLP